MAEVHQALDARRRAARQRRRTVDRRAAVHRTSAPIPDSEFFGDGLAEEILNALAQIDGLRVAARTSSFSFKGQNIDVGEIAAKLHVATVLDGSVRRAGSRVRVTLQLIDATSGFQSGPSATTATWPTSSTCRTRSRARWPTS